MNVRILVFVDSNLVYFCVVFVIFFFKVMMKVYLLVRSKKCVFYIIEIDGWVGCY